MSFHDVRFPTRLSLGSSGGPERRTEVIALANGFEERNSPWAHSRRRYDAGVGMRSLDDLDDLIAFFEARQGRLYGFRWKDWADYKSCKPGQVVSFDDQVIGLGDGETTRFAVTKTYRSGDVEYLRPISCIVDGTLLAGQQGNGLVSGTHYSVDLETGEVVFAAPPPEGARVTVGYEFDVPVRFDTDAIMVSVSSFKAGEIPDVPVVEIRL